jgi:hypothetical protein
MGRPMLYLSIIPIIIGIIFNRAVVFVNILSLVDHFTSQYNKKENVLHVHQPQFETIKWPF